MERLDRQALKEKFKKGKMPTEQDFTNLIDSMTNILDEGFHKSRENGLKVAQLLDSGKLMSFYQNISVDHPRWFLELGLKENKLNFGTPDAPNVLTLCSYSSNDNTLVQSGAVGINKESPKVELDVEGTIAVTGRRGQMGDMPVLADGQWHDVTAPMTGCEALEVVAGVGGQDNDGKYALLHVIALNTFNGNSSIQQQQAYYGNKCNRIEVRWADAPAQGQFHFKLQMRVRCSYYEKSETEIWIKYHLARLWFDQQMLGSKNKRDGIV